MVEILMIATLLLVLISNVALILNAWRLRGAAHTMQSQAPEWAEKVGEVAAKSLFNSFKMSAQGEMGKGIPKSKKGTAIDGAAELITTGNPVVDALLVRALEKLGPQQSSGDGNSAHVDFNKFG